MLSILWYFPFPCDLFVFRIRYIILIHRAQHVRFCFVSIYIYIFFFFLKNLPEQCDELSMYLYEKKDSCQCDELDRCQCDELIGVSDELIGVSVVKWM